MQSTFIIIIDVSYLPAVAYSYGSYQLSAFYYSI